MKKDKGWHYYPKVENEHYMAGTCDLYYGYKEYHEAKATWLLTDNEAWMGKMDSHFDRLQYIIYKNQVPHSERHIKPYGEIILLNDDGLMLDWDTELKKGLDCIYVSHLWLNKGTYEDPYRFANGVSLDPIGRVSWAAPDLFSWHKRRNEECKTLVA